MAPVYVKGGVWTNVEDEILKAAVSKYGLNQWSRVASLLTKKSAKQAKARWNEWINPTINKDEWTKEEDEKLLNLVKLLPNQWRSIAPIMGRTATHCVDRYQNLLEDQSYVQDEDMEELGFVGAGVESMPAAGGRVGDLNLNPESKPAKPDEETLEDEDREMLFEARARLANTKGKKAKRRDRERMLEETKRISLLQKRRELKAAGINVSLISKQKKKSKEFDYNGDIPFESEPGVGLYDTTEESAQNQQESLDFNKKVSKDGLELEQRKDKKRKQAIENAKGESKQTVERQAEIREPAKKRTKFDIPEVTQTPGTVEFEETELAGVFEPSPSVQEPSETDVDDRIKKTLEQIQSSRAKKSTLLRLDEIEDKPTARLKPKQQKKLIIELLKSSLSSLPTPKNEFEVLPQFDEAEDIILTKVADSQQERERVKSLELLREVEEAKRQLRRSQVVQRSLDIPDPSLLKEVDYSKLSETDKLIAMNFQALIKSDYKRYVDSEYNATELEEIDEDVYDKVQKEIESVMKQTPPPHTPSNSTLNKTTAADVLPPPDDETKSQIKSLIKTIKTQIMQQQNEITDIYPDITTIKSSVNSTNATILDEQMKLNLYNKMADIEQQVIDYRTDRLNKLVDPIIEMEQQLNNHLSSLM